MRCSEFNKKKKKKKTTTKGINTVFTDIVTIVFNPNEKANDSNYSKGKII